MPTPLDQRKKPTAVKIHVKTGAGMDITWADGHASHFDFAYLREQCPCATCNDERRQEGRKPGQPKKKPAELLPMYTPPAKPASAQGIGRYAIQFNWLDGHTSGIYSWDYLRRHCQCRECTFAAAETTGAPN